MKTYLLVLEGPGEGCDYTIGCNLSVETIHASDAAGAHAKAVETFDYYGGREMVASMRLYQVAMGVDIDVDAIVAAARAQEQKAADAAAEAAERAELERLQAKYGGGP
jgi:hypothetical protein